MPDMAADTVAIKHQFGHRGVGADGWEKDFGLMDDSFKSWAAIVHWNLHYRHWAALRMNARHLFTKVIWKKVRLWQR